MFFKSLISVFIAVAALAGASEEVDKWAPGRGCGCRAPSSSSSSHHHRHRRCHSSSSSSSSSSSCKPAHCTPAHSRKAVVKLQAEFNAKVKACDYNGAKGLARSNASTSIIYEGCESNTCCHREESFSDWLSNNYACGDKQTILQPSFDNIRMYANGTIVVTEMVVNVPVVDSSAMTAYQYNYHWTPIYGCNFQLTYIDGFVVGCPSFVLDMPECLLCVE